MPLDPKDRALLADIRDALRAIAVEFRVYNSSNSEPSMKSKTKHRIKAWKTMFDEERTEVDS